MNSPSNNLKYLKLYKSFVQYHLKRTTGVEIRLFEKNKILKNSFFVKEFTEFNKIIRENKDKDIIQ